MELTGGRWDCRAGVGRGLPVGLSGACQTWLHPRPQRSGARNGSHSCLGHLSVHFLLEFQEAQGQLCMTHRSQCIKYIRIPLPFAQKQVENIMEGVEDWKPHCNPSVALAAPSSWPFPQLGEELSFHCCWKTVWTLERTVFRPTRTNGSICVVRAELSGPALPLSGV